MEKTEIKFFALDIGREDGSRTADLKILAQHITQFCTDREQIAKMLPNMIGMMNSIQMQVCPGPNQYPFVVVMVVSMAQQAPGRIQ